MLVAHSSKGSGEGSAEYLAAAAFLAYSATVHKASFQKILDSHVGAMNRLYGLTSAKALSGVESRSWCQPADTASDFIFRVLERHFVNRTFQAIACSCRSGWNRIDIEDGSPLRSSTSVALNTCVATMRRLDQGMNFHYTRKGCPNLTLVDWMAMHSLDHDFSSQRVRPGMTVPSVHTTRPV